MSVDEINWLLCWLIIRHDIYFRSFLREFQKYMFTGIIQSVANIADRKLSGKAGKLVIELNSPLSNPVKGESIAVNGACLTLENSSANLLTFHVLAETFKKTNLGALPLAAKVNIERAMSLGDRLGGHLVTGHIDTTCPVKKLARKGEDWVLTINYPKELTPFLVEKGSVTVDGVSLTLVEVKNDYFTVHLIPSTIKMTSLSGRKAVELVNIETDLIGKYVLNHLRHSGAMRENSKVNMDFLKESGW
jgi:riboflavin synthase